DKLYDQDIWLTNSVQQTSSREIRHRLISWDRTSIQYPLHMIYSIATTVIDAGGWNTEYRRTNVTVAQERAVDGDHYQFGRGYFSTHADSHFYSVRKGGDQQPDPRSMSSTSRDYRDNFGSCYRAGMTSNNGTITGLSKGEGCRDDHNGVVWFAHPDGSPDNLDWEH
ncbi:MAG TPA: hypothetical protein VMA74_19370, partial [Dyella sp.]|nr:hypothetical protein [Dyella sp.]